MKTDDGSTQLDEGDKQLLSDVQTYGWHVLIIEEDDEGPGYGFSVGLFHTFGHPEVVVFGLEAMPKSPFLARRIGRVRVRVFQAAKATSWHRDVQNAVVDVWNRILTAA